MWEGAAETHGSTWQHYVVCNKEMGRENLLYFGNDDDARITVTDAQTHAFL